VGGGGGRVDLGWGDGVMGEEEGQSLCTFG
jgi:hypothetical protein